MKKYFLALTIFILFYVFVASCGDDDNTSSPGTATGTSTGITTGITGTISGLVWISIPSGTFVMGSTELNATYSDCSLHTVQLSAYQMTETEITVAQYCEFLNKTATNSNLERWDGSMTNSSFCGILRNGSNPYTYSVVSGRDNYPVSYVTHTNAMDFCSYIGATLSSEAQWEYACGGPNHYNWSLGDIFSCSSYCDSTLTCSHTSPGTCPVKSYPVNGYGLYDMSSGVWEWCLDWYSSTYYTISPSTNPVNTTSAYYRVTRGGSWLNNNEISFRSAYRNYLQPNYRSNGSIGFRAARS